MKVTEISSVVYVKKNFQSSQTWRNTFKNVKDITNVITVEKNIMTSNLTKHIKMFMLNDSTNN